MVIPFVDGTLDTEILDTQILLGDSSRLICINLKSLTVIFVTFFFSAAHSETAQGTCWKHPE